MLRVCVDCSVGRLSRLNSHTVSYECCILHRTRRILRVPKPLFAIQDQVNCSSSDENGGDSFINVPPLSWPLDQNSFLGWTSVFFMQLGFGFGYLFASLPTVMFFLALGLYFEACANHFETIFSDLQRSIVDARQKSMIDVRWNVKKSLVDAVQFHNDIRRFIFFETFPGIRYHQFFAVFSAFSKQPVIS